MCVCHVLCCARVLTRLNFRVLGPEEGCGWESRADEKRRHVSFGMVALFAILHMRHYLPSSACRQPVRTLTSPQSLPLSLPPSLFWADPWASVMSTKTNRPTIVVVAVCVLCVCVVLCVLADTTSGTLTAACTTMSASRLSSITLVSARGLPQSTLVRHRRRNISAHKPSLPQRRRRTYQARVSLRALRSVVQGQGARWSPVCLYICLSAMSASASVSCLCLYLHLCLCLCLLCLYLCLCLCGSTACNRRLYSAVPHCY